MRNLANHMTGVLASRRRDVELRPSSALERKLRIQAWRHKLKLAGNDQERWKYRWLIIENWVAN